MATSQDANRTARIVRGEGKEPAETPRARAARGRLEAEGFAIDPAADGSWRVLGFSYWPEVDMWRRRDGRLTGGLGRFILALRQARAETPDAPA